jgi:hypothetical protein
LSLDDIKYGYQKIIRYFKYILIFLKPVLKYNLNKLLQYLINLSNIIFLQKSDFKKSNKKLLMIKVF